ncbi:MAG: F0F1 ATP synthase subunit B [Lachnospiraceae bacterium]|nr:F0F1 ATP synthase subunit B [Lachnospiraceae bacterium]
MEPRIFGLDFQLLNDAIIVLISVFVLFLLASYLLFNPVRKMLDNRRAKIKGELETAAADMAGAAALKKEYDKKLKNVNAEVDEILSAARKQALVNENRIIAEAREEAARIISRAQTEAELEKEKAADAIKTEIIDVAALMAGKAISDQLNIQIQEKLINDTLKEMGKSTWQS